MNVTEPPIQTGAGQSGVMWRDLGQGLPADSDNVFGDEPEFLAIPSPALREASSVSDMGYWFAIGEAWSNIALRFAPTRSPRILDIGCGCGKMARFFLMTPGVTYLGIDIFPPAIAWCRAAFAEHPGFQFRHFDVRSALYNGAGTLDVQTARVPAADRAADLIICGSLFTHLLEPAFLHYAREVRRCLSPIGRAVVSIHNEPADGHFSGEETRIDISDAYFTQVMAGAGLSVHRRVGTVFGQEVYVLEHARSHWVRLTSVAIRRALARARS